MSADHNRAGKAKQKPAFLYSDRYNCDLGGHVLPAQKYDLIFEKLVSNSILSLQDFERPGTPSRDDLLLVHTPEYLKRLLSLVSCPATLSSELPLTRETVDAALLAAAGTILALKRAHERGSSLHVGGGFHHAFPDHAEGFCYLNDVAIAARKATRSWVDKVAIIDCDLHQGNGTAWIFRHDPAVFTFSMHQENNYPVKETSDLDIGLEDGVGDEEYLERLEEAVSTVLRDVSPSVVLYLAGADPYREDQLGGLQLTIEGLRHRDELVIGSFHREGIPVCTLLAGGYALKVEDTVSIHYNTCLTVLKEAAAGYGESAAGRD